MWQDRAFVGLFGFLQQLRMSNRAGAMVAGVGREVDGHRSVGQQPREEAWATAAVVAWATRPLPERRSTATDYSNPAVGSLPQRRLRSQSASSRKRAMR